LAAGLAAAAGFAQDQPKQPEPVPPSKADILGPQLIAWSELQKPQPVSPPAPVNEPQEPAPAANTSQAQTFSGAIIRDGSQYVLRVEGDKSYQLDDQERAKRYEGKQVRIKGTVDSDGERLRILSIELIS